MKKLLLIFLCFLSFAIMTYAQINTRNFHKSMEILVDTSKYVNGENPEYNAFLKKNTKQINAEVFQVLEESDTLSFCLVRVYKESKLDYKIAMLVVMDEIIYEGKEFDDELCFLAGTYTYETKADEKKTVPLYYTRPCYNYMFNDFLKNIYNFIFDFAKKIKQDK